MGTRGLYGIRKHGVDKLTYNHWDSYPDYLGHKILEFCSKHTIEDLNRLYDRILLVNTNIPPTKEQIEVFKNCGYLNLGVGEQSDDDWYCLLHRLQGNINAWNKALEKDKGIPMSDDSSFIKDSLFCEYVYIINLDDNVLEYYEGFQKQPQRGNRYGIESDEDGYFPCKLIMNIPLDNIQNKVDYWVEKMNKSEKK